jgi:hypothetical protein
VTDVRRQVYMWRFRHGLTSGRLAVLALAAVAIGVAGVLVKGLW